MVTVKASDLITLAQKALSEKWGYIWSATGQIHTQEAQDKATREQTIKWGARWIGKHVLDCSGLFYWAYKQHGGYMYHGCNTMWQKYSTAKGKLVNGKREDGLPLKPGCAVYMTQDDDRHHVGMYIGNGFVIEAKGTYYGVVKSSVKVWNEWSELTGTDYNVNDDGTVVTAAPVQVAEEQNTIKLNTLKTGSSGDQVKALQRLLNGTGYSSGTVDGKFGTKTTTAVKAFQKAKGLTDDGICGLNTWKALLGA